MSAVLRILVCYLLAAGFLFLGWTCLKRAKAGLHEAQVGWLFKAWTANPDKAPSGAELSRIERVLRGAVVLDPDNPVLHEQLCQLYLWQLTLARGDPDAEARLSAKATAEARRGVSLRPAWPMAWARLLGLKATFDVPDDEFRLALRRATALGPWDFQTSLAVVAAVLPIWEEVSPEDREVAMNAAIRGFQQKPKDMLPVVQESGRLVEVCAAMAGLTELHQQICSDVIE
ncbi:MULTISPECIES: hypothetical protein [Methylococcus]|uniref:Uncharacterized protein n=1 Tax=Methylococcus capsulatus TaxID=414 RepID=A0ABZ2F2R8_METCP|nr:MULTISPECIES: hypothetical protein [Methylococcus]MDF9393281.1 hypothetical protein [Methylococcus capsulatus]